MNAERPWRSSSGADPDRPLRCHIAAVVLAFAALTLLVVVARLHSGAVHRIDVTIDNQVNRYVHRRTTQVRVWKLITDIGGPATWRAAAGIVAVVLWLRTRRRDAVLVAVVVAGAAPLSGVIKLLVGRARPVVPFPLEHVGGASFPSSHALTSSAALGLLVVLAAPHLSRGRKAILVIGASASIGAVGASRLMLGVHYLSDVLGAWLIAGLWLSAAITIARWRLRSTST